MKKLDLHKITLKSLLENNKFVVFLSIVLAVIFWCSTAIKVSPIEKKSITEVTVAFDFSIPEQSGLLPFSQVENVTVDVTVEGKKSKLSSANKDVLSAKVDCSEVSTTGTYPLPINVSVIDEYANDFKIVDVSQKTIRVWFDTLSEVTANIEPEISGQDKIANGYIMGVPALSTDVVSYSGPTQSVNQVENVVARASLPEGVQEAVTVEPHVVALDKNGNEVKGISFSYDKQSKLSLIVPILKEASLPVGINFLNAPTGFTENDFKITYSPATVPIAASNSYLSSVTKLPIGTIDFTGLGPRLNTFEFDLSKLNLKDVTVTDPSIKSVVVTIDLSDYSQARHSVGQGNIQITNAPEGYHATLIESTMENVGVIGPASELNNITSADLYAVIDLTDVVPQGSPYENLYKAKVTLKNQSKCWVIGTYTAYVRLTKS